MIYEMTESQIKSISSIVEYLWEKEREDFLKWLLNKHGEDLSEATDDIIEQVAKGWKHDHIFGDLVVVSDWLTDCR